MWDKDTTNSTFFQLFQPVFSARQQLKQLGVDKYVKKLTVIKFIVLVAYAQLNQHRGLRDISNSCNNDDFSQAIKLTSISAAQLSRRLRSLVPQATQALFRNIVYQVGKAVGFNAIRQELGRLYLIDATTVSLCLSQYPWAEFRKTKGGVKLHLRLRFYDQGVLPDKAVITPARPADKTQMDALVVTVKDALNVFDRGYTDYEKFDQYCEDGIRFITRLKSNAQKEVVKELPVDPEGDIDKEQIVYLGTKGINRMKHPLRLVETKDSEGNPITIVTNDFELPAAEISAIYRNRWQIELFFKWLKQHFCIKHFYGLSQRAVENQLYIALITYCLLMLLKLKTGYQGPLLTIKRMLHTCLYEPLTSFVRKLHQKFRRSSKGRRRIDHEAIFQETLRQVMQGEADHLDDLTYDPVIL